MKLKNPPVHEVLIEVRFQSLSPDYTIELSSLREKLLRDYPNIEPLSASKIPLGFPEAISRHRFLSEDRKHIVHLGENVISVNTLDHEEFSVFAGEVKRALSLHKEIRSTDKINRIGLRYINKIDFKDNISDILDFSLESPNVAEHSQRAFAHKYVYESEGNSLQIQVNKTEELDFFYLDLDYFSKDIGMDYDIDQIFTWADAAHSKISESFENCLNPTFFKSLNE